MFLNDQVQVVQAQPVEMKSRIIPSVSSSAMLLKRDKCSRSNKRTGCIIVQRDLAECLSMVYLGVHSLAIDTVADLGEGPPLFWQKKMKKCRTEKSCQDKRYSQINFASTSPKNRPPPPLAKGLDPPLGATRECMTREKMRHARGCFITQRSIQWWYGKTRKNPIAPIWNSTYDLLFLVRMYQHLKMWERRHTKLGLRQLEYWAWSVCARISAVLKAGSSNF